MILVLMLACRCIKKVFLHTARTHQVLNHIQIYKRALTYEEERHKSRSKRDLAERIKAYSHPYEIHRINTYLAISLEHAKTLNKNSCLVCTHVTDSMKSGIPRLAVSFKLNEWCGYSIR